MRECEWHLRPCRFCALMHNPALCISKFGTRNPKTRPRMGRSAPPKRKNIVALTICEKDKRGGDARSHGRYDANPKYVLHSLSSSKEEVILLSKMAQVENLETPPRETPSVLASVLMDGGSQSSFITNRLARQLGLRQIGKERMSLFTMTKSSPDRKIFPVYEVETWVGPNLGSPSWELSA